MKSLTMADIKALIDELERQHYNLKAIKVYLGNDEELNGTHTAYYVQFLQSADVSSDTTDMIEFIKEENEFDDVGVLIS